MKHVIKSITDYGTLYSIYLKCYGIASYLHMPIHNRIVNKLHKKGMDESGFIFYKTKEFYILKKIEMILERVSKITEDKCNDYDKHLEIF